MAEERTTTVDRSPDAPEVARPGEFTPLSIGPLEVWPPVVLAPMAGVTNAAFRRLCRSYGAGLYVSEMVNARGLIEGGARSWELAAFDADEPMDEVFSALTGRTNAIVVAREGKPIGVLTRTDLLEYLAHKR